MAATPDDLKQKHRKIAEEFESLQDALDSSTSKTALRTSGDIALSLVSRVNRRHEVGQKWDEVVGKDPWQKPEVPNKSNPRIYLHEKLIDANVNLKCLVAFFYLDWNCLHA